MKKLFTLLAVCMTVVTSAWADEVTVADKTSACYFAPVAPDFTEDYFKSQFIYSADKLTSMKGTSISQMVFYSPTETISFGDATINVYIGTTTKSYFEDGGGFDTQPANLVYSGSCNIVNNKLTIPFTTAFDYPSDGGNLIIQTELVTKGNAVSQKYFYGMVEDYDRANSYPVYYALGTNKSEGHDVYLPKVTFTVSAAAPSVDKDYLCFTAEEAGIKVSFTGSSYNSLQYLTSGSEWQTYKIDSSSPQYITLTNKGDKVYFRITGTSGSAYQNSVKFTSTGKVAASGNVMSILYSDFENQTSVMQYAFSQLFKGCTGLTSAPKLPATSLGMNCYSQMFQGCTGLTSAPELPAKTISSNCYDQMFRGCTNLTVAPELPATTLANYCYDYMFYECTSLATAPELPATTLANYCYQDMFYGCKSLTTAPELPATTLKDYCYDSMFYGCTSLTTAPELPATALEYYCYQNMFYGCTSLNSVTVNFTDWKYGPTSNWLYNVASTGTFTCPAGLSIARGASKIPEGWTVCITLSETTTTAPTFSSTTTYNVIVNRTLKANQWNSLCLPFSMTGDEVSAAKLGTVMKMESIADNVVNFADATEIEAGEMYIVKPTEAVTSFSVTGKTLSTPSDYSIDGWTAISYMYGGVTVPEGCYVISNDNFYYVNSNITMNGFRWYLSTDASADARQLGISFNGEATGITTADIDATTPKSGKFIENGRVVIVKNNHKFNLNGQEVK